MKTIMRWLASGAFVFAGLHALYVALRTSTTWHVLTLTPEWPPQWPESTRLALVGLSFLVMGVAVWLLRGRPSSSLRVFLDTSSVAGRRFLSERKRAGPHPRTPQDVRRAHDLAFSEPGELETSDRHLRVLVLWFDRKTGDVGIKEGDDEIVTPWESITGTNVIFERPAKGPGRIEVEVRFRNENEAWIECAFHPEFLEWVRKEGKSCLPNLRMVDLGHDC